MTVKTLQAELETSILCLLSRIIKESENEDEVMAALAVYKKITGREYDAT